MANVSIYMYIQFDPLFKLFIDDNVPSEAVRLLHWNLCREDVCCR